MQRVLWAVALMLQPPVLASQTIAGVVLDSASRRPLAKASIVALRVGGDSSGSALTDSSGVFYLNVQQAGSYRLRFFIYPSTTRYGDTVAVGSDEFVERRYVLAVPSSPMYCEFQVPPQCGRGLATSLLHIPSTCECRASKDMC